MKTFSFICVFFLSLVISTHCYGWRGFGSINELLEGEVFDDIPTASFNLDASFIPVYIGPQDALKEADAIESLPGQPAGVDFDQYSGYVTVNPSRGRALFYYFAQSPHNSSTKPLVLWLNGGPGCSSLGGGALMELGPFRVNKDGQTLYRNQYAWNKEANIIFLESPAGVGFSYSNTTSDYNQSGDNTTAIDSYSFLRNWLERFPEYKTRDLYLTGESYAGHYVPQLAQLILRLNKLTNQTLINLKGIAIGNAYMDRESNVKGSLDFFRSHALISDETYMGIISSCNFSSLNASSPKCTKYGNQVSEAIKDIYQYNIYYPWCPLDLNSVKSTTDSHSSLPFDPCSLHYITSYLNIPEVQKALHANVTSIPYPWMNCSDTIHDLWKDKPLTVLPIIKELMESGIRVWIYSGDTDGVVPVTSTRYSIEKLVTPVKTAWYPWYMNGEVGGYAVGYQNLTFVTIRGSGHFVPSYQPARALALFSSFINGKLPPPS